MSDTDRTQEGNAGNRGDVLKHLALVGLLLEFRKIRGRLLYAETHAFRSETALPPPRDADWRNNVEMMPDDPVTQVYKNHEEPFVAKGRYSCSVGIASALLPDDTDLVLCEKGRTSIAQLRVAVPAATILDDNREFGREITVREGRYDGVLGLVDPYQLKTCTQFDEWLETLSAAACPGASVDVLVFDHLNRGWPNSESIELVAHRKEGRFALALYSGVTRCSTKLLSSPGWIQCGSMEASP